MASPVGFLPPWHHGASKGSACGPISITSPSPSSRHLSTNREASRNLAGDPMPLLGAGPGVALPPLPTVACDKRLRITELARLTSDLLGLPTGTGKSVVVVVNRAPADPGLATSPCDASDEEQEAPRKRARACVGRDTGELFDVGDAVPVPMPISVLMHPSELRSDPARLITRLLRRAFFAVSDEKRWNEWERSRPLRCVLLPASVSSQMEGTRVTGRPAEWGRTGRASVGSG